VSTSANQPYLAINDLWSAYGNFTALQDVNFEMRKGEFLTLLGPSGSGKSSLLMVISGFAQCSGGAIRVEGKDLLACPPHRREIGVVFQNYALFPHMTVLRNVLFPLEVRKVRAVEARRRALQALDRVGLGDFENRRIDSLSGGQRQRVALARAVVAEPCIVLMDEPLSALDKSLREEMQVEIRRLHDQLGFTTIYVTHDQREAMAMADRIAVMNMGRLEQVDTPEGIYHRPQTSFVASFMGHANLLPLDFLRGSGALTPAVEQARREGETYAVLRAEDIRLAGKEASAGGFTFEGRLERVVFQGESWLWQLALANGLSVRAIIPDADHRGRALTEVGTQVLLWSSVDHLWFVRDGH
jgi:putative spermidine/putrescine transport system ATP-binding protein